MEIVQKTGAAPCEAGTSTWIMIEASLTCCSSQLLCDYLTSPRSVFRRNTQPLMLYSLWISNQWKHRISHLKAYEFETTKDKRKPKIASSRLSYSSVTIMRYFLLINQPVPSSKEMQRDYLRLLAPSAHYQYTGCSSGKTLLDLCQLSKSSTRDTYPRVQILHTHD